MARPPHGHFPSKLLSLLPTICLVCGKSCTGETSLCCHCEEAMTLAGTCCRRCGLEFDELQLRDEVCASCLLHAPSFTRCRGLFQYKPPLNKLLSSFKFQGRFEVGHTFSILLARQMKLSYRDRPKPDLLLPVPLHRKRLRQRGFNQALEIARLVSRRCRIPLATAVLERVRNTDPQTELKSARVRKMNLHNAFRISDSYALQNVNRIALLDDVVTTMATVEAASQALRSHGIPNVEVWCLARVGHQGHD